MPAISVPSAPKIEPRAGDEGFDLVLLPLGRTDGLFAAVGLQIGDAAGHAHQGEAYHDQHESGAVDGKSGHVDGSQGSDNSSAYRLGDVQWKRNWRPLIRRRDCPDRRSSWPAMPARGAGNHVQIVIAYGVGNRVGGGEDGDLQLLVPELGLLVFDLVVNLVGLVIQFEPLLAELDGQYGEEHCAVRGRGVF